MAENPHLVLYLPRGTSRDAARRLLTDHAEYGEWELARLRLFADGSREGHPAAADHTPRTDPLTNTCPSAPPRTGR